MMLTGLLVFIPDKAKAYPDNAWIVGNVTDGVNPIENAYVKVMIMMGQGQEVNYSMTDASGDYSMMVPGGLMYIVFAADGDHYMAMNSVTIAPGETKVANFTLMPLLEPKDVTISGYVTDDFGNPRWDGHVMGMVLNPMGGDMPYYANMTTPDPVTGYYEVTVIAGPMGGGAAGMDFPGYPMSENSTSTPLVSGMSYQFDIHLQPAAFNDDAVVYGYVTEMGSGTPLESAVVQYEWSDGMNRYSNWTMTNESGYYEMGVHSSSNLRLTINKIGYTYKFFEINVPPAGAVQQDAELRVADAKIRGNVTDASTGNPIQFCRVFLVDNTSKQENITMAVTDFNGYFDLDAFEGNDLFFGAEQDGYAKNLTMINVTSGDQLWHDFTLQAYNAWLVGQVTNAMNGAPLDNVQVHVVGPIEDAQWTNGMGMYNISLVPGDYFVEMNRWVDFKTYNDTLTIPDGVETVLNVSLVPYQNAIVKGQVYDVISGDPVPWANIWLNGWWGNSTNSNETGYYEMYNAEGSFDLSANAPGYMFYSEAVVLAELSVNVIDIGMMPQTPATTTLLYGYVNNTDDSTPISGAEVRIRLNGSSYENSTMTDPLGYYEMYVPPWVLDVKATAGQHAPLFAEINLTGVTDYSFDIMLDRDSFRPNMTHSQAPLENISWTNPSFVDVMIEEQYLREMTLMFFMEWNSSGLDSNWTMVQYQRTSFDPWNPESNLPYSMVDGNYSVNIIWNAWGLGGILSNGTEQGYFPASAWMWYSEPAFAVSGTYSNSTQPRIDGAGLFNVSSGDFMAFWPYGWGGPIVGPDPTAVFEPLAFVLEYDNGSIVYWNWRSMGVYNISDLKFSSMTSFPSGNYKTEFFVQDWGGQGDIFMHDLTVDNDSPTAEAGPDQNVPENAVVTLNGTASSDNVGIAMYQWEFFNATGVWTVLFGDVVTYSFESSGSYLVNLSVWDGAGHESKDSMTVNVFVDDLPIANAGPDQVVDEDTIVTFDGSGSSDDNGIVNYSWVIQELSEMMYDVAPQFTFVNPGNYHVSLVVMDTVGQTSAPDEMQVYVRDLTPPVADAGPDIVVLDGDPAMFNGTASTDNGMIISWVWTFFDGIPRMEMGQIAYYTFSGQGLYLVTLTVTDEGANSDSDDFWVTVSGKPIADAGPDQTVDEDTIVTFDGSGSWDSDGIDNYTWTIIELSVELYDVGPTYTFSDPGTYHVSLVVIDGVGQVSDPDEMIVTVNDVTAPTADAGPDQYLNNGTQVTFDGSASYDNGVIVNFTWFIVDLASIELYGAVVNYTFSAPGSYWVQLAVTDSASNTGWDDMWVYVNGPPVAGSGGDLLIYSGDWAYFTGWWSSDDFDPPWMMEFTWNFTYAGSEVVLTGFDVWYQFIILGDYTVTVTVRDTGGLESNTSFLVTVVLNPSAWWVDPRTDEKLVDGATISLDYAILRGYVDSDEEVDIITPTATYVIWADGDGYFELYPLELSDGLNIVTIMTYNDWWGQVITMYKMIRSDTYCVLWVDSPESPTTDSTATISGMTDTNADVTVNGVPVTVMPDGTYSTDVALSEGSNVVNITATDPVGNMNWAEVVVVLDTTPPSLVITGPVNGANVSEPNVLVHGTVESGAEVRVNGVLASGGTDWSATVALVEGANTITVIATDSVGNTATQTLTVNYVPPVYVTPEELAAVRAELLGEINNLSLALQENVTALQGEIDAAMAEIAALQTSLSENISALQAQIDTAMDEILALQASLAENITALQVQINAALSDIAALQASVAENVTALQDQINTAMADIAGLQASLLENVTALQTQITDAMADIVALETALTENVTALQDQITANVLDISELQAALAENVTALQSDIAALEADLQANITALQQAIAQNATALQQALAQNVTALQSQIAALRSELQANVTALTNALGENVTALDGLIDALGQDLDDLQTELAAVNSTLTSAQADMEQALDAMQSDLDDMQQLVDDIEQASQDAEEKADNTDSFASMLMYLTLILFAIAVVMIALVWYLTNKKLGKGGAGPPAESLEEVEEPTEVEKEFESLEKEIKEEEL